MNSRLVLAFALCCLPGLAACGGDGNETTDSFKTITARTPKGSVQISGTPNPTAEPDLTPPASLYTVLNEEPEVGPKWYTDIPGVWRFGKEEYADGKAFADKDEGMKLLDEWGYQEGYETSLIPEGRDDAVLNGNFSFKLETHLFDSSEGAHQAYEWFNARLEKNAQPVGLPGEVGNEGSAWSLVSGTVGKSNVEAIFHTVLFRRGNLVAIVQTFGSSKFMTVADAFALAQISDRKALGERELTDPTPTSNYTPPAHSIPRTPVSAGTPTVGQ